MQVYRDEDIDRSALSGRKVAILGYGAQGHAHALNLRDSGDCEVAVALRPDSASAAAASDAGFTVLDNADAARWADLVMMLAPDESIAGIYAQDLHAAMRPGAAIGFAHGLAVHFGLVEPRADLDVIMIAPKGAGYAVRAQYVAGGGIPCLIGIEQDATGGAKALALAYAAAIGGGRSGVFESSFREECESDLFSEQAVLCGGLTHLIHAAFETLTEAGYAPEVAYFECLHEVKLIADLVYQNGIAAMRRILADVQSGRFVSRFVQETQAGQPELKAARKRAARHPIESVGAELRALMPFVTQDRPHTAKR